MTRGSYQEKLNFSLNFYTILQIIYYEVMKTLVCDDIRLDYGYIIKDDTEGRRCN